MRASDVASQTHQAQTGAIALLGMHLLFEQALDQLGGRRAHGAGPGQKLSRRPVGMRPVRRRHVLGRGRVAASPVAAGMAGHAPAVGQDFDAQRDAQLDFLAHQFMRHAVVVVLELDVVIDVDPGAFPLGDDEGTAGSGLR